MKVGKCMHLFLPNVYNFKRLWTKQRKPQLTRTISQSLKSKLKNMYCQNPKHYAALSEK